MSFKKIIQGFSFTLFFLALVWSPDPLLSLWPSDGFLRMDPIACLGTWVADRRFAPLLWVTGLILLMSIVLGRFFCAYLCPMGITIDFTDHLLLCIHHRSPNKPGNNHVNHLPSRRLKYHVLAFILGAASLGVSFVFIASPLCLITRFYGLIIYPAFTFLADMGLTALRPVADRVDLTAVAYAVVKVPRYDLQWVTFISLLAIFACGLMAPRFWCRYLCPSGALLAICTRRTILRRQVSPDCTQCGLCLQHCSMDAIGGDNKADGKADYCLTDHAECISCLACVKGCPARAVSFAFVFESAHSHPGRLPEKISKGRRRIVWAGLSGAMAAILTLTGLKSPHSDPGPGSIVHPAMIRPPGALPENVFLARCLGCGTCMQACPTNSLQPLGVAAGLSAIFSPVITPRRGPCDPGCNACGRVCPTGAIAPLPMMEKLKAKVGTARLFRQKCLAWELQKKCLICDEVCPFDAIEFRKLPGQPIAVPFVNENKCAGCGYCEHFCPVRATPAIVVEPMLAIRLYAGSYRAAARERGYSLQLGPKTGVRSSVDSGLEKWYPSELDESGLPPGFTK